MYSDEDTPCRVGCPIRRPRDHRSLASPPGFSQRATSFIASQCQGIHQMPFSLRLIVFSRRRAQGQNPVPTSVGTVSPRNLSLRKQGAGTHTPGTPAASHEDTSRTSPRQRRQAYPPRSHDNSLFTLQSTPAPGAINIRPERNSLALLQPPLVEVNGFEPMTSCLQSRRSPS